MSVIDLFFAGLALLGWWLTSVWQSLGTLGQAVLIVGLLLIVAGCIATVCQALQALVERWQSRRAHRCPVSHEEIARAAILSNAVNEALLWSVEYWQAWPTRKEDEV